MSTVVAPPEACMLAAPMQCALLAEKMQVGCVHRGRRGQETDWARSFQDFLHHNHWIHHTVLRSQARTYTSGAYTIQAELAVLTSQSTWWWWWCSGHTYLTLCPPHIPDSFCHMHTLLFLTYSTGWIGSRFGVGHRVSIVNCPFQTINQIQGSCQTDMSNSDAWCTPCIPILFSPLPRSFSHVRTAHMLCWSTLVGCGVAVVSASA